MDSADWPASCDLITCSTLFAAAGMPVDVSSLSRYIAKHAFPSTKEGRSRLVDPKALFTAFAKDYTRRKMSAQSYNPVPQLPTAPTSAPVFSPPSPKDDPRLERDRIILQQKRMELGRETGQLTVRAEVEASAAESMAEFRAAIAEKARDHAEALVLALHLPAAFTAQVVAAFKSFGRDCQLRFAEPQIRLAAQRETPGAPERERFFALVRYALELRGELDEEDAAPPHTHVSEGASAPSESSGEA